MSRPFWLRPLRLVDKPTESVAEAAVRGKPLETLLRTSAGCLLDSMNADRAGVWAEHVAGESLWRGCVAHAEEAAVSAGTCDVNAFEVFPVEFNDADAPIEFFAPVFPAGPRSFFEGIATAVGMPLKMDDRILGALLVASERPGKMAGREMLESISAEIALALYVSRSREQQERTHQALHLREEVEHLLANGTDPGDVLRRILSAIMRQTGAQFAGVARRQELSLRWEALSGAQPPEAFESGIYAVATAVFLDRETVIRDVRGDSSATLSVVGLPLGCSRDESVVLLAGYRCGDSIPVDTLESFRAMAANARVVSRARETALACRALFESGTEALLIVGAEGHIAEINRQARALLPWKSGLGTKADLAEFLAKPERGELAGWFSRAASEIRVPPMEAQLQNGVEVRLSIRQALGAGRFLLGLEEGAVVERAERHGKQARAELRSVLDAMQAGVALVSADGRIRSTNARFGALFGVAPRLLQSFEMFEALTQTIEPRFRAPDAYRAPWNAFIAGSGGDVHDELEITGPAPRILERYARPVLNEEGQRIGWLEIFWDVTAQRQLQAKLLQTEKMAAVGQLAAGIAHELNNPLTSIMGYAQLLLGSKNSEQRCAEAKMVFDEAERARRIVRDLLSFARPAEPERTRADINEIIERTVALRSYELKLRNISVRCELEAGLPLALADPHQLQQVILNLLVNAEQAILENGRGGLIEVRTRSTSSQRISIEICDNGPGIPPEIAARLFDPFFTTKPAGVGTGLGLAIVRSIVEQHEGEVSFENLPDGGAKFKIQLPIVPVPAALAPPITRKLSQARSGRTARILIVENEPTVAHLVADVLREEGHQIEAVLDGQEGLQRVSLNRYDLVICDLRMPRLDGPAFYDALVRAGNTARHRILFITGDTLGPHTIEFLQSHQLEFLAKPFLVQELKMAVCRVLERATPLLPANLASAEAHR